MKRSASFLREAARAVTSAAAAFALWTVWLLLALFAALQVYIAARNEVKVPDFVLRRLEARAAESGFRVTFDVATFDPTGRILVHSPRVFLPGIEDPIVTARAAYVGLNPWALLVGKPELREIRLLGGSVAVPAILSASGKSEPIVDDIDAVVLPGTREWVVRHVTGRIANLPVSVHGTVALGVAKAGPATDVAAAARQHFQEFCRGAAQVVRQIEGFEDPVLDIGLERSSLRGAVVTVELVARGFKIDRPIAAELRGLRLKARLPLFEDAPALSRVEIAAERIELPNAIALQGVAAVVRGRLRANDFRVDPEDVDLSVASLRTGDYSADAVSASFRCDTLTRWQGTAVGRVLGSRLAVSGAADLTARTASVQFAGTVDPQVIDVVSARTHVDVRKFFTFETLQCDDGRAEFGPGWRFERLSGHVELEHILAHGVAMDEGSADIRLDPQRLYAPEAYARIGQNFARGSYEHEFATRAFRFLLEGRLRPMDIAGWFHPWWPKFFARFEFPAGPPPASVDVQGIWREGRKTSVFIFVDAAKPVIVGQPLQRVRTRLFVRPGFYDGLEVFAADQGNGTARGEFALTSDLASGKWRTFDVDATSTVAFGAAAKIASGLGSSLLEPFELAQPPAVKLRGHFDGPASPAPPHRTLDLEARTSGELKFGHFPMEDVSFTTTIRDDEFTVDNIVGKFSGGTVAGRAKVWGTPPERRLGFDASVKDASLGRAATALQNFMADRKGQPHPVPGKFVQEKANVLIDAAASAEGLYGNQLSFHGAGNAALRGAEIGEVPIFGPLSALLKFTALRFTTADATFKINGPKLDFSRVALRGANSAVDAHGQYLLDRRELEFFAKVFPFEQSGNVLKSVVGVVLSPISNVLEVKLTGTLEKPDWAFVIGPTNFFRSLTPSAAETAPAHSDPASTTPAPDGHSPAPNPPVPPTR
jgi:hypothetical protein